MDRHGEVVLRQRVCPAVGCHAVFWICRHCDRGQRYCSDHCRSQARRGQRRRANATCIVTLLDRLLHHADVTVIEGNSYRVRESEMETAARRRKK